MKRLTHEEFMEKFYKKNKNAESIEILSKYKGSKAKIKCKCKLDGYEWETTPNTLLRGSGCKKCGYKWESTPSTIRKSKGCLQCYRNYFKSLIKKSNKPSCLDMLLIYFAPILQILSLFIVIIDLVSMYNKGIIQNIKLIY